MAQYRFQFHINEEMEDSSLSGADLAKSQLHSLSWLAWFHLLQHFFCGLLFFTIAASIATYRYLKQREELREHLREEQLHSQFKESEGIVEVLEDRAIEQNKIISRLSKDIADERSSHEKTQETSDLRLDELNDADDRIKDLRSINEWLRIKWATQKQVAAEARKKLRKEHKDEMARTYRDCQEAMDRTLKGLDKEDEKLQALESEVPALRITNSKLTKENGEMKKQIDWLHKRLVDARKDLDGKTNDAEIESLTRCHKQLIAEINKIHSEELEQLRGDAEKAQKKKNKKIVGLRKRLAEADEENVALKKQLAEADEKISDTVKVKKEHESLQASYKGLKEEHSRCRVDHEKVQAQYDGVAKSHAQCKQQLDNLQTTHDQLVATHARCSPPNAQLQASNAAGPAETSHQIDLDDPQQDQAEKADETRREPLGGMDVDDWRLMKIERLEGENSDLSQKAKEAHQLADHANEQWRGLQSLNQAYEREIEKLKLALDSGPTSTAARKQMDERMKKASEAEYQLGVRERDLEAREKALGSGQPGRQSNQTGPTVPKDGSGAGEIKFLKRTMNKMKKDLIESRSGYKRLDGLLYGKKPEFAEEYRSMKEDLDRLRALENTLEENAENRRDVGVQTSDPAPKAEVTSKKRTYEEAEEDQEELYDRHSKVRRGGDRESVSPPGSPTTFNAVAPTSAAPFMPTPPSTALAPTTLAVASVNQASQAEQDEEMARQMMEREVDLREARDGKKKG